MKYLRLLFILCLPAKADIARPLRFDISKLTVPQPIDEVRQLSNFVEIKPLGIDVFAMTFIVHNINDTINKYGSPVYVHWKPELAEMQLLPVKEIAEAGIKNIHPLAAYHNLSPQSVAEIRQTINNIRNIPLKELFEAMRWVGR